AGAGVCLRPRAAAGLPAFLQRADRAAVRAAAGAGVLGVSAAGVVRDGAACGAAADGTAGGVRLHLHRGGRAPAASTLVVAAHPAAAAFNLELRRLAPLRKAGVFRSDYAAPAAEFALADMATARVAVRAEERVRVRKHSP